MCRYYHVLIEVKNIVWLFEARWRGSPQLTQILATISKVCIHRDLLLNHIVGIDSTMMMKVLVANLHVDATTTTTTEQSYKTRRSQAGPSAPGRSFRHNATAVLRISCWIRILWQHIIGVRVIWGWPVLGCLCHWKHAIEIVNVKSDNLNWHPKTERKWGMNKSVRLCISMNSLKSTP